MAYIAPIHRPTSVRHALCLRFLSPDEDSLVLAKSNRIEIWRLTNDGLACLHSKSLFGNIVFLQRLRPKGADLDLLLVGTDRFEYFTLSWDSTRNQLETIQTLKDESSVHMVESESANKCVVDQSGRFLVLLLWEGVLSISRLPDHKPGRNIIKFMDQVRISHLFVKACCFLFSETGPKIAFLYQTRSDIEDARLAVYRLTADDKHTAAARFEQKEMELNLTLHDEFSKMLIPVREVEGDTKRYHIRNASTKRAYLGGLLVIGETRIIYIDSQDFTQVSAPMKEANIFVAWAEYDETRYFLADDYGGLHLLTIQVDGTVVTGVDVSRLGPHRTSRASSLVYMGQGALFIGSHSGDSQLAKIDLESNTIELLVSPPALSNNAPVLDFAVMEMASGEEGQLAGSSFSSGQARIVAGCGAYHDGSLRSIRSGVGLIDYGIIDEVDSIRGLFALRSDGAEKTDTLVVSLLTDTRVFRFDSVGGIEEATSYTGLSLEAQTLFTSNVGNARILQITPLGATIIDGESGVTLSSWEVEANRRVTDASANSKWALLSIDGKMLVSLDLTDNLRAVTKNVEGESKASEEDQIACVHAGSTPDHLGVVGFWKAGSVSVIDLATLEPLYEAPIPQTTDSSSVPRDLALVQLHSSEVAGPTLLVAMEDGVVVTFSMSRTDYRLSSRMSVSLGTREARLHILPSEDGVSRVFATTEHSSLIYSSDNRIIFSATTAEDATYVVPFDCEVFPGSIVIATERNLRISHIEDEKRTHVNVLSIGETVRRISYSQSNRVFGLGCIKKELDQNQEVITTSLRIISDASFQLVGAPFPLSNNDSATEMPECVIVAKLPDARGNLTERFIVGTSVLSDTDYASSSSRKGRILVFGVDTTKGPFLLASRDLQGACFCLGVQGINIVAGMTKSISIYKYTEETSFAGSLQRLVSTRTTTYPKDLAVADNLIGVADLMKSLTILEYVPGKGNKRDALEERARHFQPAWGTAVCPIGDASWLESDADGNLMVLRPRHHGESGLEQRQLEVTSEMHLGDNVNRIRRINVPINNKSPITPAAILGTTEGGIYLFATVSPDYQDLLMKFQARLADSISVPGQTDFKSWRAVRNPARSATEPFRFLDGELLERFLEMSEERQDVVCSGLGPSVEDMRNLIEGLSRAH